MQEKQNKTALIWFRNDLRVTDNQIIHSLLNDGKHIIALYCFDPRHFKSLVFGFKKTEKFRAQFLIETVTDLKQNLAKLNINLLTYHDTPENCIPKLVSEFQVDELHLQNEWTQEEREVFESVKESIPKTTKVREYYNQFLYHPDDIKMEIPRIPRIFTEFRKHVEKQATVRSISTVSNKKNTDITNASTTIPTLQELGFEEFETHPNSAFPFKGGETAALQRLNDYFFKTKKLGVYKKTRNGLIGTDFSSKFSPWLANGSLSAKTIYWEVQRFEKDFYKNDSTYWLVFELIWRDYFKYISLKHGNDLFKIGGILQKDYEWSRKERDITNWIEGTTNEPFVNANMLELNKTGWMSNRGRQNVASYFAKELLIDWRIGAAYFESMLVDYDVHSNYGNWMYVAGVGNDPRDRKFNVKFQAENYDPNGKFQALWLQNRLFE